MHARVGRTIARREDKRGRDKWSENRTEQDLERTTIGGRPPPECESGKQGKVREE